MSAIDGVTLGCRLRLYDVAHCEVGQGSDRWSQSANAFKRCARHFGVGRYLTQLPPLRLKLGEGIPVNAKGRPYVTDQLLEILRRQYEEQIRAASDRFGAILPHPGVGTGDSEGELPTHPEVEAGAQTKDAVATGTPAPYGTLLRMLASTGQIDPAELANLIYAAVGEAPRPSARAAAALDTLLERIPEEVAQRTLHDIAARADQPAATGPAGAARVGQRRARGGDVMALDPPVGSGDVGELYAELARRLERIVRAEVRASASLIEDACQFAWWRLVVHVHRVERRAALSWLAKTAVREALKLIRREERDVSLDARLEGAGEAGIPSRWPGPDQVAEQRAQLELLRALPMRQRMVLVLQAAGFTYEETAASLGMSRRTVERQIMRGRQELRAASHA